MDNTCEIISDKSNYFINYKFIYRWLIPLFSGILSFKYELSLQKRLGNKLNNHTYVSCCGAALVGFLFTKYIFTSVDYYNDKKSNNIVEKSQSSNEEIV